ncbi:hypothetical protein [Paraburkholderia domus]|uniref:hypothetical protein n=1 Tax=Paraburkholderia domus TaxID=2793075 RepID=UPI001913E705|nr:hypothetical protein [Paraburkholderia domus]MBK5064750.1 hypothetical protein [Burkholderia sp. R-70199]CAE6955836.1 hypothetical protein R70199_06940 [Paraburkholderia domus]
MIAAARAALIATMADDGLLTLPSRRRDVRVTGLSGNVYDAWCDQPPELVRIRSYVFRDHAEALITLDDGRELAVILVGGLGPTGLNAAAIEIVVDDPSLAAMAPDELRSRIRLLASHATWRGHWRDEQLTAQAEEGARELAIAGLDWVDGEHETPEAATPAEVRETLLHRKAKEILLREKRLMVPDLVVVIPPLSRFSVETKHLLRPATLLHLQGVMLEQAVGNIRPDLKALTVATANWPAEDLLVEITVSNGIDAQRIEKIRARDLPTLEIDLSKLGGRLSEAEFARLIVHELAGKRWIHHPALATAQRSIEQRRKAPVQRTPPAHDPAIRHATNADAPEPTRSTQQRRPSPYYESKYPSSDDVQRRSFDAKRADFWLKGAEREAWDRRNPESPYSRFHKKDEEDKN